MKKYIILIIPLFWIFNPINSISFEEFINATKSGNEKIVNECLRNYKHYINVKDKNKEHALIHATRAGNSTIVNSLIPTSFINIQNNEGKTAIIIAIAHKHYKIAKTLASNGALIDLEDNDGNSARKICPKLFEDLPQDKAKIVVSKKVESLTNADSDGEESDMDTSSDSDYKPTQKRKTKKIKTAQQKFDEIVCPKCHKKFETHELSLKHITVEHLPEIEFKCRIKVYNRTFCDESFGQDEAARNEHERTKH